VWNVATAVIPGAAIAGGSSCAALSPVSIAAAISNVAVSIVIR
jgi:hypothetical protein